MNYKEYIENLIRNTYNTSDNNNYSNRNYFKGFRKNPTNLNNTNPQNSQEKVQENYLKTLGNNNSGIAKNVVSGLVQGGIVGGLIGLGKSVINGAHRKNAKQQSSNLVKATNQSSEIGNQESDQRLTLTQQSTQELQDAATNALSQGLMTGGAAPMETDPITDYQNYLRENGYSDEVINGIPQGLNYGNKEVADWINQYNTGAGRNNPINIPITNEEIEAARAGNFNVPTQSGGVNSDVKQSILDKFMNGITDFSRGYQENRNTAFAPENLLPDKNKGNMQKAGEAFGTIGRMAQNPATQALIAGGISTALTGDPLYGAGMAYKFGNQRQMSDIYKDILAKNGVDVNTGLFGNITSSDMNTLMTPKYKEALNNIALAKLQETQNYHDLMMKYYNDKLEETKKNNAEKIAVANKNANARQTSANASVVRANNSGKSSVRAYKTKTQNSGQFVVGETPNGKKVKVPVEKVKEFKSNGGKIIG